MAVYSNSALFGAAPAKTQPVAKAAGPAAAFSPLLAQTASQPVKTTSAVPFNSALGGASTPAPSMSFQSTNPSVAASAFLPPPAPPPLQAPGNNLTNPGYTEQGLEHTQNRLLEDPYGGVLQNEYESTNTPTQGENYLNQNQGTLEGPGQGDQYWNQVQGQFNDPFAGEQFARQATQAMGATGAASAFNNQAQSQYQDFTGYSGPQNAQSQYGANQASGPLAGQQFYDQVGGQLGTTGTYSDPNLAAGQYQQTQQAFGDLPIADFDPFYDRARQLGVQSYNQDAAGRGVYGSSEALSGVGNVITDIEAQRANRSFDAEMQRAQEQRARQGLLGEQARMGDMSSVAGFNAGLAGLETFGGLARTAGDQSLGQQTMLGSQANMADTQALGAQEANLQGLNTYGDLAGQADTAETNRFNARTGAMTDADRTGIDRFRTGADIAFRGDESARADYTAEADVAATSAGLANDRTRLGADIANTASDNDLQRLNSFTDATSTAENDRQARQNSALNAMQNYTGALQSALANGFSSAASGEYQAFEDWFNAEIAPSQQDAALDQQDKDQLRKDAQAVWDAANPTGKKEE